ncbi:hypothetical protein S7335_1668 [Synechococcus sp. PCC 7335]|uniref:hypothetical protein n=1 Tax=Synechococcus sp. (strain ATCC 29403 / PCC 7335) TaxID=91464 RepID=UPI00017EB08D|nr:hypothetical protein [Synechococcus sp. PCC 7335]EDX83971.1 hypothetical protein S7335_1668 [Synechococcus sp. PCC 7335]
MLLSTFELLLKPITPNPGTVAGSDRGILQGYFLNVANPTNRNLRIRLRFNATTPSINPAELLDILDTGGTNNFAGSLVADGPNRFRYDFSLSAGDTGLFILQPDILNLDPATDQVEVRGFVEVFIVVPFFFGNPASLLLTPEHRGTFLPSPGGNGEFDQLAVSLPTSTGASLMEVDVIFDPPIPHIPLPNPIPIPLPNPTTVSPTASGLADSNGADRASVQADLPQILNAMAERIESIENGLAVSQS